ncbi:MAG: cyclic nucleotide-binding protein [Legionellaceae bacterium]|nr:cyclic nucleotide-binding protein [Legionellaceae bacterium]HAF87779.1 cyclic nucleotide-binding domain-containing protein [Legionellales bacterium]
MIINHLNPIEIMPIIDSIMLFTSLDEHEKDLIASRCHFLDLPADTKVIEQGEIADTFHAIVYGRVIISIKSQSQGWVRAGMMSAGNVFGEIAIIKNIPRIARVTTYTSCRFLTINSHDFLEIYHYFSAKARDNIQLIIAKRLEQSKYYTNL